MLNASAIPAALYPIALCNFRLNDLHTLDKLLRLFAKRLWRLPRSTPLDVLHIPQDLLGVGIPRMLPLLAQKLGTQLMEDLSDTGSLGTLLRHQLHNEIRENGTLAPTTVTWDAFVDYPLVRTLALLAWAGVNISLPANVRIDVDSTRALENTLPSATTRQKVAFLKAILNLRSDDVTLKDVVCLKSPLRAVGISDMKRRVLSTTGRTSLTTLEVILEPLRIPSLDATDIDALAAATRLLSLIRTCRALHKAPFLAHQTLPECWATPAPAHPTAPIVVNCAKRKRGAIKRVNDEYISSTLRLPLHPLAHIEPVSLIQLKSKLRTAAALQLRIPSPNFPITGLAAPRNLPALTCAESFLVVATERPNMTLSRAT